MRRLCSRLLRDACMTLIATAEAVNVNRKRAVAGDGNARGIEAKRLRFMR